MLMWSCSRFSRIFPPFTRICLMREKGQKGDGRVARALRTSSMAPMNDKTLYVHRETPENNADTPFEFNAANLKRIEVILKNYPEGWKRSGVMALLDLAQRQHGWLPITAMHRVADILQMPRMRVYEIATFYDSYQREPCGKYLMNVCTTTPCWLRGSDEVMSCLQKRLGINPGETTTDRMFTLREVSCRSACVNGPVIQVNDDYFEELKEEDALEIVEDLVAGRVPRMGPRTGRFASEPVTGQTTLLTPPYGPGFKVRADL